MSNAPDHPFFSVIIPTKNRPELLVDAIESVLRQDFFDYELIISDNYNDDRTKAAVETFLGNPRLHYVRTDRELNMPDHWEFATSRGRGRFILVLTDRSVLKQGALKHINRELVARPNIRVCSWRWTLFDEDLSVEFGDRKTRGTDYESILCAEEVAQNFTLQKRNTLYQLPRGLNSCYDAELSRQIRDVYGTLFRPISPDYTSAFLLLAHVDSILYINRPLFISQGLRVSNGGNAVTTSAMKYISTLSLADPYLYVPIKEPLVENTLFCDYIQIKDITTENGGIHGIEIDWSVYFIACYREILEKMLNRRFSLRMSASESLRAWQSALKTLDGETQAAVRSQLPSIMVKLFARKLLADFGVKSISRRLEYYMISNRRSRESSILIIAGFPDAAIRQNDETIE